VAAGLHVLLHALQINVVADLVLVTGHVQADLRGVLEQMFVFEVLLVGKQQLIHGPELALRAGGFGGFGGHLGMGVHFAQREVPEDKAQLACRSAAA
jgi:hypothetical protein